MLAGENVDGPCAQTSPHITQSAGNDIASSVKDCTDADLHCASSEVEGNEGTSPAIHSMLSHSLSLSGWKIVARKRRSSTLPGCLRPVSNVSFFEPTADGRLDKSHRTDGCHRTSCHKDDTSDPLQLPFRSFPPIWTRSIVASIGRLNADHCFASAETVGGLLMNSPHWSNPDDMSRFRIENNRLIDGQRDWNSSGEKRALRRDISPVFVRSVRP